MNRFSKKKNPRKAAKFLTRCLFSWRADLECMTEVLVEQVERLKLRLLSSAGKEAASSQLFFEICRWRDPTYKQPF